MRHGKGRGSARAACRERAIGCDRRACPGAIRPASGGSAAATGRRSRRWRAGGGRAAALGADRRAALADIYNGAAHGLFRSRDPAFRDALAALRKSELPVAGAIGSPTALGCERSEGGGADG